MSNETLVLQQLVQEVTNHRNQTEKELDAVADILQRFGTRLVSLEATVDRLEKEKADALASKGVTP